MMRYQPPQQPQQAQQIGQQIVQQLPLPQNQHLQFIQFNPVSYMFRGDVDNTTHNAVSNHTSTIEPDQIFLTNFIESMSSVTTSLTEQLEQIPNTGHLVRQLHKAVMNGSIR